MKIRYALLSFLIFFSTFGDKAFALCQFPCIDHYYVSVKESISFHNDISFDFEEANLMRTTKFKTGFSGALAVGVMLNCFRLELEGAFRRNDISSVRDIRGNGEIFFQKGEGWTRYATIMGNLYYDFYVKENFGFYGGLGAGIAFNKRETLFNTCQNSALAQTRVKRTNDRFAYQGIVGVFYELCWVRFSVGYHFFATTKLKQSDTKSNRFPYTNNIDLGVLFYF